MHSPLSCLFSPPFLVTPGGLFFSSTLLFNLMPPPPADLGDAFLSSRFLRSLFVPSLHFLFSCCVKHVPDFFFSSFGPSFELYEFALLSKEGLSSVPPFHQFVLSCFLRVHSPLVRLKFPSYSSPCLTSEFSHTNPPPFGSLLLSFPFFSEMLPRHCGFFFFFHKHRIMFFLGIPRESGFPRLFLFYLSL